MMLFQCLCVGQFSSLGLQKCSLLTLFPFDLVAKDEKGKVWPNIHVNNTFFPNMKKSSKSVVNFSQFPSLNGTIYLVQTYLKACYMFLTNGREQELSHSVSCSCHHFCSFSEQLERCSKGTRRPLIWPTKLQPFWQSEMIKFTTFFSSRQICEFSVKVICWTIHKRTAHWSQIN